MYEGGDQPSAPAPALTVSRVLRGLFDLNAMYEGEGKRWWAWWLARVLLWGLGGLIGGLLWELAIGEPADARSFVERFLTNAYLWATVLTTAVCALVSGWRKRR
jgi:polyferredoxin